MAKTTVKRRAVPLVVQRLWQAIRSIRSQKQVANVKRLTSHLQREFEMRTADIEEQLQYAVEDGLIVSYKAVAQKGSNVGLEQDGYRITPFDEDALSERDGHDWYCFDCHKGGEVVECTDCWRVFHVACTGEESIPEDFVCSVCKDAKKQTRIKRKELNRLLGFTIVRLKDKSKELHNIGAHVEGFDRFVYNYLDLNTMEEKTAKRCYKYLEQFFADARTILHNVFICFGECGLIPDLSGIMIRDCQYDLDEIRQCKDCYRHSNAKPKNWFCQPCRPPHDLVFAKQKGFTYWPAKVIKVTQEGYDVRFFGSLHQRATILPSCIRPIDINLKQLAPKRTAGFNKAMKELSVHQQLLESATHDTDEQSGTENDLDENLEREDRSETAAVKVHHKKFHKRHRGDDTGCDSSGFKSPSSRSQGVHEDAYLVSSSEDQIHAGTRVFSTSDVAVQTMKKSGRPHSRGAQTDETEKTDCVSGCDCDVKFSRMFDDYKTQVETDHRSDKERALKELEERLRKDSEEAKQAALSRAMTSVQREVESTRWQTEQKCKEEHGDEVKRIADKHKREVSLAKKKQWCYNCEEEAMYHCCWNTSYCSIKCQQEHWHHEHKRMCRRKRN